MRLWTLIAAALISILVAAPASAQQSGSLPREPRKFALLIGNQNYRASVGPLRDPHNDVELVAAALRKQGFTVSITKDATRAVLLAALDEFAQRLRAAGEGTIGFFYYSGHGAMETDTNTNYLIPIDVTAVSPKIGYESVSLDAVLDRLARARDASKFVVLDAARNELGTRGRSKALSSGFVPVLGDSGVFTAFSTSPGRTASDGRAGSGPYASALAAELDKPGQDHLSLFLNVKERVLAATSGAQRPWESNGLRQLVYIAGPPRPGIVAPTPPAQKQPTAPPVSEAGKAWELVKDSRSIPLLEAFAKQFLDTFYTALAQQRIAELTKLEAEARAKVGADQRLADIERQRDESRVVAVVKAREAEDERLAAERQLRLREEPVNAKAEADTRAKGAEAETERQRLAAPLHVPQHLTESRFRRLSWDSARGRLVAMADDGTVISATIDASGRLAPLERANESVAALGPAIPWNRPRLTCGDGVLASIGTAEPGCIRPGDVIRDCPTCPEMVVVPAGEFAMGSPDSEPGRDKDEGPQHKVTIAKPFAVGKVEATFDEWDACVADNGCKQRPADQGWGRGKRPVINVSWDDAKEFVTWLARKTGKPYRLLTEAEWEYAARAGSRARWSFGDNEGALGQHAWYTSNSGGKTQPVGGKQANAFGLYDMHGNAHEWVEDCWVDNYNGAPTDGTARTTKDCGSRVLRGGGWLNTPGNLRAARRIFNLPGNRNDNLGFRLARTLFPSP